MRDGLKPVHRRVLFAMSERGLQPGRPYAKCAAVVGDVLGKYHPHGDSAAYDTLVRMAQWFSLRYPLVDGQGNFGNQDGYSAAAMRYTECRLRPLAVEMLRDIDAETVDFMPNYDGRHREPLVLPSRFPNLLVNGSAGHRRRHGHQHPAAQPGRDDRRLHRADRQPGCDAGRPDAARQGPGLPDRGARSWAMAGIREAYETGRGRVIMRAARAHRGAEGRPLRR